jgi:hypothetical protein
MADRNDGSIAPRRSLSGPILPPPPPEMLDEARKAKEAKAAAEREKEEKKAAREAALAKKAEEKAAQTAQKSAKKTARKPAKKAAPKQAGTPTGRPSQPAASPVQASRPAEQRTGHEGAQGASPAAPVGAPQGSTQGLAPGRPEATSARQQPAAAGTPLGSPAKRATKPRRTRRARLRLVQVDAWSVMKTSFLLSIALGIVLVVAVAIIWAVLGAAGVWESINSIVQQAIGGEGDPFDIQEYAGTSRVLGFTMIVAVIDVILITAISTLGAFLYNLSAALLGGIEVTLAEDN